MQDNAPANTSVDMAAATKRSFEVLPHPPPFSRFSPFRHLSVSKSENSNLHGRNFGSSEGIIDAVDEYLGDQEEGFCFKEISKLNRVWGKYIKAKGDYIEK